MCGIFGVSNSCNASFLTYVALYSLQHRGQESCGIVVYSDEGYRYYNSMGLVNESFTSDILKTLCGNYAIGHVRYSTTGLSNVINSQPLFFKTKFGDFALAHNGNIVNFRELKEKLSKNGSIFQTTTDSEIIAHLISSSNKENFIDALVLGLEKLKGAYSFIFLYGEKIIAARDPWGFRPLVIGKKKKSFAFASETCALDAISYSYVDDVKPGEIVIIEGERLKRFFFKKPLKQSFCIFEQVYFARPDSIVFGHSVFRARYLAGIELAKEKIFDADIVSGVPDSGIACALGYSYKSGIRFMPVFMKNHYTPRSFIQPQQDLREFIADLKLLPIKDNIKNKRIILIDDSIVRGTTSRRIVSKLRNAGAKKIYMLIASPQIKYPCYYGIDTPTYDELIANRMSLDKIKKFIGVDELYHLSLDGLIKSYGFEGKCFCTACFDGRYPV